MLHTRVSGSGDPVVLIHGFTQSGRAWDAVGAALRRARHRVVAIDAPGHGRSAGVATDLPGGADLMVEAAAAAGGGRAAWVGYSMGGRYALHVALRHRTAVSRLVLVSATGGIDDTAERGRRRDSDEALAAEAETIGLEPFVAKWLTLPLFATLPAEAAAMESRLEGSATGLASSLRLAGTGTQEPLWDRLPELGRQGTSVLVIAGALDAKYVALGERLAAGIGARARMEVIEGAGHACHLEKPERFMDLLIPFLAQPAGSDP